MPRQEKSRGPLNTRDWRTALSASHARAVWLPPLSHNTKLPTATDNPLILAAQRHPPEGVLEKRLVHDSCHKHASGARPSSTVTTNPKNILDDADLLARSVLVRAVCNGCRGVHAIQIGNASATTLESAAVGRDNYRSTGAPKFRRSGTSFRTSLLLCCAERSTPLVAPCLGCSVPSSSESPQDPLDPAVRFFEKCYCGSHVESTEPRPTGRRDPTGRRTRYY